MMKEKDLLVKELCSRLPYGVKCAFYLYVADKWETTIIRSINPSEGTYRIGNQDYSDLARIKPYLRPLSSMTEEEREELKQLSDEYLEEWTNAQTPIDKWNLDGKISYNRSVFYNSHHLDWNGLIEKCLALEATEGMYNTKTE